MRTPLKVGEPWNAAVMPVAAGAIALLLAIPSQAARGAEGVETGRAAPGVVVGMKGQSTPSESEPTGRRKIDLMLSNVSIQFKNPGYIAEDVAPIIPVCTFGPRVE